MYCTLAQLSSMNGTPAPARNPGDQLIISKLSEANLVRSTTLRPKFRFREEFPRIQSSPHLYELTQAYQVSLTY